MSDARELRTQFQILSGKLPLQVVSKLLEVYVDVIVVIGSNHLHYLELGLVPGFLLETQRSLHRVTLCVVVCIFVNVKHIPFFSQSRREPC